MIFVISILCAIGLAFISSAQGAYSNAVYWHKQLVFMAIGATGYFFVSRMHYKVFLQKGHWVYMLGLALLMLLWVPGIGKETGWGASRWIGIGPFSFQPAEAAKLGTLLLACSILSRSKVGHFKDSLIALLKVACAVLIPFVLIFAQPDLGSAMVLPPMTLSLLYAANLSKNFFRVTLGICVLLLGLLTVDLVKYVGYVKENKITFDDKGEVGPYDQHSWVPLKDYQRNRILTFIAPSLVDPSGTGVSWNQRQSLITVGSGGLLGKGWGQGTQAKLGYLPQTVAHNDFIFSVIAEESGFLGATTVLALFSILLALILHTAVRATDRFGRLLCVGVATLLLVHIFVNIAMTIGLMPVKGIPLPFVSYGGSFILSAFILCGMVRSVDRHRLSKAN